MRKIFSRTFIVAAIFLGGCASPRVGSGDSAPSQKTAKTAISSTASFTALPGPTSTPTLAMPPFRTPVARETLPASGSAELHILHWNDFHGELAERYNGEGTWIPGAARLAAYVNASLAKYGRQDTLLMDAGDWFENTDIKGESKAARGRDVLAFYQRLGVDAITVGNHDLFLGLPYFRDMVARAIPIQILSVNLRKSGPNSTCTNEPLLNPYQIYELGAADAPRVRVAVIGISMERLETQSYRPISGPCFRDPVVEVEAIYDDLFAREKPDVVVLLSHSGMDIDQQTAEALNAAGKPVDLIIGGHSHTWTEAPLKIGKTIIVQAGDFGRAAGDLDLVYDRATSALRVKWHLESFGPSSPQDPGTLGFLKDRGYASQMTTPALKSSAYAYLTDLPPASASVGFWSLGKGVFPATDSGMITGELIYSHRKQYPNGLFAHSPSDLRYVLDGKFKSFRTEISIKETACGDGASFVVLMDGQEIHNSGTILPSDAPRSIALDVSGGKVLELKTIPGLDMNCDWTIWGDPYLVPAP